MTKLTPGALALVDIAGREWIRHKAFSLGLEAQIRARVEAEMEVEKRRSAEKVAAAMQAAIDGGSTKAALRLVTTKDRVTFENYLALLNPAEEAEAAEVIAPKAALELSIAWARPNVVTIGLDPATVYGSSYAADEPKAWEGPFEVYRRESDGKVFIDPTGENGFDEGIAVAEWIRADDANLARVVEWVEANPQV